MIVKLFHYHDPMCSWCWAYRPTSERLFESLPRGLERVDVLGGLAPDSDEPMPAETRRMVIGHWRRIEAMLGTRFNHDFWERCQPRRSTYPACRAVIAAAQQGSDEAMTHAIQEAYYLNARNPSDEDVLVGLANNLGLNTQRFARDLRSKEADDELHRQIAFTRNSPVSGLPALALGQPGELVAIPVDYRDHRPTLELIESALQR